MGRPQDDDYLPEERALMEGKAAAPAPEPEPELEAAALADAPAPAEAAAPAAEPAAEDAGAPEQPAAEPADEPFIPQFKGEAPADYDAQKKTLRDEKSALRMKWSGGEITDEEFAAGEARVDDQLEALLTTKAASEALEIANRQVQAQQQQQVVEQIRAAAKAQGLDYGTREAPTEQAGQFDTAMTMLMRSPAWQGKAFAEVAAEAHRAVAALNGKLAPAPAPTPAPAPAAARAAKPVIPPTLGQMPTAAPQNTSQDLSAQLDAIDDPDLLEARWASMPKSQRDQMLRSTMRN